MKLRSLVLVLGLTGVVWVAPAASSQPLDSSLLPFATKPDPRPDYRKVLFIVANPDAGGRYYKRFGTSGEVFHWKAWLERDWPNLRESRANLDEELGDLRALIPKERVALLKVVEATSRDALIKFNSRHDGKPLEDLFAFSQSRMRITVAEAGFTKAQAEIAAANASVDEAVAGLGILVSTNELATLAARKEAIMKKAREASWMRDAFNALKTGLDAVMDPEKAMRTVGVDFVVGGIDKLLTEMVLKDHWEELVQIADREEALNKLIADDRLKQVRSKLEAARQALIAARFQLVQAAMRRTIALAEAKYQISALSLLEEGDGGSAPKLFRALWNYQIVSDALAGYVDDAATEYLFILWTGPSAKAGYLWNMMNRDVADVSRWQRDYSIDFSIWLEGAEDTRLYLGRQDEWFKRQTLEVQRLRAAVDGRAHWNLTEATVAHTLLVMQKGGK